MLSTILEAEATERSIGTATSMGCSKGICNIVISPDVVLFFYIRGYFFYYLFLPNLSTQVPHPSPILRDQAQVLGGGFGGAAAVDTEFI